MKQRQLWLLAALSLACLIRNDRVKQTTPLSFEFVRLLFGSSAHTPAFDVLFQFPPESKTKGAHGIQATLRFATSAAAFARSASSHAARSVMRTSHGLF